MAYNFDKGFFHTHITKYVREVLNTPPPDRQKMLWLLSRENNVPPGGECRRNACSNLQEFCRHYRNLGFGKIIDDSAFANLYKEYCLAFHSDTEEENEELNFYYYYYSCSYVVHSILPDMEPCLREDLIVLLSEFAMYRDAMERIIKLVDINRQNHAQKMPTVPPPIPLPRKSNVRLPTVVDEALTMDLSLLDVVTKKLISDWNTNWEEILRGNENPANIHINMKFVAVHRYCRTNLRCRIINCIRDRFPKMNSWTRKICLGYFYHNVKTIFDMLPLLGLDIVLAPDYPSDRCIFKNTSINCCVVRNRKERQYSLTTEKRDTFADQVAVSDLPILMYASCLELQDVMDKPRMAYTNNFST